MTRWLKFTLLGAAAALVMAGGYASTIWREIDVVAAPVETDVQVRTFGIGTVEAQVVSKVGFQIPGKIVSVLADQGDLVKAGALLAKLDDEAQRARLMKSEIARQQAAANLLKVEMLRARAEVVHRQKASVNVRRRSLVTSGAVSSEAAEDAQTGEDLARGDLRVVEADAAIAAVQQDDAAAQQRIDAVLVAQHDLRAPFDARVIVRHKEPGSIVTAGEAVLTLIAPESIWVRAYVDEALAGGLSVGQTAYVRLRSDAARVVETEVVRIDQENDRLTEERRVYVRCRNCSSQHMLRVLGEQAEVEIVKTVISSGRFVPINLVEGFDGRSGLLWVVENGRLAMRRIPLGERLLDGRIQIAPDLPSSVPVVAERRADLREGRRARVTNSGP